MKTLSVLFTLAALFMIQPDAFAQRGGGETRGGGGDTRGSSDGGSSRGSSYDTRGSSSSSSSSGGYSGGSSSDWGSSSGGCYDCYSGGYSGGGYSSPRVRNTKFRDLDVGMKVTVSHLGENGVITELYKRFFNASLCVELEKSKEEVCGLKPKDVRPI